MKILFSILLFFILAACDNPDADGSKLSTQTENPASADQLTTIQWIDSVKNLGRINEGQKLEIVFRFKNTGDKQLIIQAVQPSCGCTVADYPKEPIAPGKEAEITGSFDSKGRDGLQRKEITVIANTKGSTHHIVRFEVEVVKQKT